MTEKAWSAHVKNVQGVEIPATDIPWMRAREMWIHAVDLDVGASFADLPVPMLVALVTDVVRVVGAKPDCPPLRLATTDVDRAGCSATAPGPRCAARRPRWRAGRSGRSRGKNLRTSEGKKPPVLPRWL